MPKQDRNAFWKPPKEVRQAINRGNRKYFSPPKRKEKPSANA